MADRLFTSSDAEMTLSALRHVTKIEYAALARLALCYSLSKAGDQVPRSVDGTGKEIRLVSLFGGDDVTIRTLVNFIYGRLVDDDELAAGISASVLKDHVDNGLRLMSVMFRESSQDPDVMLQRLSSEARVDSTKRTRGIYELDITIGTHELNNERLIIQINNTQRHANSHLAIMGKPGTGKTQFLLKVLADLRDQSRFRTNFVVFDYKGDISANERFVDLTRATVYRLPEQQLPVNPFILDEYSDNAIMISTREKADSFGSISPHFGVVQKGSLHEVIRRAYDLRSVRQPRFPDFREVFEIAQAMYEEENKRDDSLIAILRDLSSFHLFWEHGNDAALIERVSERTMIVDLHRLPVLKELVAYLVVERLYKEMTALPDSQTKDGRRELRTVLVIDEAHNYLHQKNPFLQRIIREGRSKGVVVFFASQSPNDYTQKFFDFKELLEFSMIFQCEGVSSAAIQDLLGCSVRTAKDLQVELARLLPFQVISKGLGEDDEYTRFKADAFYQAYR